MLRYQGFLFAKITLGFFRVYVSIQTYLIVDNPCSSSCMIIHEEIFLFDFELTALVPILLKSGLFAADIRPDNCNASAKPLIFS